MVILVLLKSVRRTARSNEAKLLVEMKINTAAYAPMARSKVILSPRYSLVPAYRRFSHSSSPIVEIAIDATKRTQERKKRFAIRFSQKNLHTLPRNQ